VLLVDMVEVYQLISYDLTKDDYQTLLTFIIIIIIFNIGQ